LNVFSFADVSTDGDRSAAGAGDLLDRSRARGFVQVQDADGHPVRGQPARGGGAYPPRRTRHDRDSLCHRRLLFSSHN
jgi:hypothetical protein